MLSFFTIWSNILVTVVALLLTLDRRRRGRVFTVFRIASLVMITDHRPGRPNDSPLSLVVLVVVAVAQRRLGPRSSASTSTVDRALPSSAVQVRCWSRPMTTTRLPLLSEWAGTAPTPPFPTHDVC